MFMANISFFHKFDNLAAILNILAYFIQTQSVMHVYLNFYVRTHHKDSKKPYVINVYSRWHLAPSEAGLWVKKLNWENNWPWQHTIPFVIVINGKLQTFSKLVLPNGRYIGPIK